ncbi:hypothetical protein [Microvirga ossetica]|nr:hypothetical protein [Microvirga ossetica]
MAKRGKIEVENTPTLASAFLARVNEPRKQTTLHAKQLLAQPEFVKGILRAKELGDTLDKIADDLIGSGIEIKRSTAKAYISQIVAGTGRTTRLLGAWERLRGPLPSERKSPRRNASRKRVRRRLQSRKRP